MISHETGLREFRRASMNAENWFPAIIDIWHRIPGTDETWHIPAELFQTLIADFQSHSPVLNRNRDSLIAASRSANYLPQIRFRNVSRVFNCSHLAILDGTETFLRDIVFLFQASFAVKKTEWWHAPGVSELEDKAGDVKLILDRWVLDWEPVRPDVGFGHLEERLRKERQQWENQRADFPETKSQNDGFGAMQTSHRPNAVRDATWVQWEDEGMTHATIRDRWNRENPGKAIKTDNGNCGRDTVKNALARERKRHKKT